MWQYGNMLMNVKSKSRRQNLTHSLGLCIKYSYRKIQPRKKTKMVMGTAFTPIEQWMISSSILYGYI